MFMTQAASLIEAARTLGAGRMGVFFRVALPLARPAIAVGVSLALLETLNDIGASEFLGVQTLTVSVYTTWITRSDLAGAAQIALTMLAFVLALVLLERRGRKRQRYANTQRMRPMQPQRLRGAAALAAFVLGWIPVLLGFVAPALYLVAETYKRLHLVGGSPANCSPAWATPWWSRPAPRSSPWSAAWPSPGPPAIWARAPARPAPAPVWPAWAMPCPARCWLSACSLPLPG